MSLNEPDIPYFRWDEGQIRRDRPFVGAHETSVGNWRQFPITTDSPHEPWCMHFEWGACNCGPRPDEVFVETGTTSLP